MRYRQMVGLLTASSIRSFRNHRGGIQEDPTTGGIQEDPTTGTTERISSADAAEDSSKRVTLNPNASAEEGDDPANDDCGTKHSQEIAVSTSHGAASATTKRRRRRRCSDPLVAMDVAFYLFHNQNQDTVVHSKQSSLSSMKQAQLLSKDCLLSQMHQHHPGFVPIRLWQGFMAWEKQPLASSIVSAASEDAPTKASSAISPTSAAESCSATSTTGGNRAMLLQFVPVCFDCGGIVQPGVQNTTLRLVHNGRHRHRTTPTQRRRESRRKAALAQKQHQTMKQHVNHWKSAMAPHCLPDARSKLWHYIWQQQNKYYHSQPAKDSRKLYPFMNCCKNYCIVTCGCCAAPIYLPGMSSNTLPTRSNDEKKKRAWMPTNASNAAMLLKHPLANTNPSVSQPKNDDVASFSELPASLLEMRELGSVAVATTEEAISVGTSRLSQATSEKRKLGDMASPMPSLNSRKKKKKKNTPKSKELLSFLSSLNDGRN